MHTYMKNEDGSYSIGLWLPNKDGIVSFNALFDVESWYAAVAAVSMLNGGTEVEYDFRPAKFRPIKAH